jgi:aryl-alcohol dehydrogenase-like predicted oxidoreductase
MSLIHPEIPILITSYQSHKYGKNEVTNLCGNSKKSMHVSIRDSLRKLQTDYVDIFYIHFVSTPTGSLKRLT